MTPLKEAMDLFMEKINENTSGSVKVKLYKGNMYPAGIFAKKPLFDEELATIEEDSVYTQADATGFINLFGLSTKTYAKATKKD